MRRVACLAAAVAACLGMAVLAAGRCRLATIFGSPGMGKSRLAEELMAQVDRAATVVRGRCLSHGRGITFWPVLEIVRKAAGILEEDSPDMARAKIGALAKDDAPGGSLRRRAPAPVTLHDQPRKQLSCLLIQLDRQ